MAIKDVPFLSHAVIYAFSSASIWRMRMENKSERIHLEITQPPFHSPLKKNGVG